MTSRWPLAATVALSLSFTMSDASVRAEVSGDEQVVAKVNGVSITKGEVRQRVEIYERGHPGMAPGEARVRRAGIAVQVLVDGVLEDQLARELGVTVTEADVEASYAKVRGKKGEKTFALGLRLAGSDPQSLRRDLRRTLVNQRIMNKLADQVVVTEGDLRAQFEHEKATLYPEQVKARQIIVLTEDLARRLYEQIKGGADFAELARTTSTERSSREQGGDLGWVLRGTGHLPPWDDIVFNMKAGVVSEPFETGHGWHLVKVEGHRSVGWGSMDDQRKYLTDLIKRERAHRDMKQRMEELKKRADIWMAQRIDLGPPDATMNTHQRVTK